MRNIPFTLNWTSKKRTFQNLQKLHRCSTVLTVLLLLAFSLIGCGAAGTEPLPLPARTDASARPVPVMQDLEVEHREAAEQSAASTICRLEARDENYTLYYGSCIAWQWEEEKLFFLAPAHLVEKTECYWISGAEQDAENYRVEAELVGVDTVYDLAVLTVPADKYPGTELVSLHKRIYDTLDEWSEMFVLFSSPEGTADCTQNAVLLDKNGTEESLSYPVMLLRTEGSPGMSGGGVYDGYGHLSGMVIGGYPDAVAALTLEEIMKAVDRMGVTPRNAEPYRDSSLATASE